MSCYKRTTEHWISSIYLLNVFVLQADEQINYHLKIVSNSRLRQMSSSRVQKLKSNVSRSSSEDENGGCCYTCRMQTSLNDIRSLMFWKALFAEFLGTFILVIVSLGSTVQGWQTDTLDVVQIALTFGLAVATSVWIIGHISGGHINPAVTIGMLVTRRVSLLRAIMYIVCQCLGSIAAAGLLKVLTPAAQRGGLGTTSLSTGVTPAMGFGIELCITMFLVLTVFATCDSKRTDHAGSFPLSIGLSVTMGHLWAVSYYYIPVFCVYIYLFDIM